LIVRFSGVDVPLAITGNALGASVVLSAAVKVYVPFGARLIVFAPPFALTWLMSAMRVVMSPLAIEKV